MIEFILNFATTFIVYAIIIIGFLAIAWGLLIVIAYLLVATLKYLKIYKTFTEFLYLKYKKQ